MWSWVIPSERILGGKIPVVDEHLKDARRRMEASVEAFRREISTLRAGRASPALLEKVRVDYYGTPTPINQLANISVPEPRLLVIQPWDKSIIGDIERALLKSDLGLTPTSDGNVIRISIPQPTAERRQELVKQARRLAEESRVAIRNVRRDLNEELRNMERQGEASEDECRRALERAQKMTDEFIQAIDSVLKAKEAEILEM